MVATRKATTKKTTARKTTAGGKSKDPVDAYFQQQPPDKRILLEKLRALVAKNVPDAQAAIKWGVPIYQRNGRNICAPAITAFRGIIRKQIKTATDEVDKLKLGHRPHAHERRATSCAHDGRFGNRSINHALWAKLIDDSIRNLERAAVYAHVFAD